VNTHILATITLYKSALYFYIITLLKFTNKHNPVNLQLFKIISQSIKCKWHYSTTVEHYNIQMAYSSYHNMSNRPVPLYIDGDVGKIFLEINVEKRLAVYVSHVYQEFRYPVKRLVSFYS